MKKSFIFIFLIAILAPTIQAQDLKGKVGVGLDLSVPYIDASAYIQGITPWRISPNIGYFIGNSWQVGIRASLDSRQRSDVNTPTSDQNISRNWQVELLSSHYQWLDAKWAFFAEHGVGYGYSYSKSSSNYSTQTIRFLEANSHNIDLNTRLGTMFMISKRFGVNLSTKVFNLSYTKTNTIHSNLEVFERDNYTNEDANLTTSFLMGANLSFLNHLQLGLRYFL